MNAKEQKTILKKEELKHFILVDHYKILKGQL